MARAAGLLLAAAAASLAVGAVRAQDIDAYSKFRVTHPPSLVGAYRHSEALFGRPEYGGSLFGVLVYATPQENRTGCHPFSADPSWPENVVVMVDRGDCTFETKVRNAENAGAVATVIADTHDVCELGVCKDTKCDCGQPSPGCECRMPLMADDGSSNVKIPSFLIPKVYADQFKACLAGTAPSLQCSTPTPITVSLAWDLPAKDGRVDLDLWTTSDDPNSAAFRASISHLIVPLGEKVKFHPHFFIYNGLYWGCTQSVGGHYLCDNQCTTSGKYCSPDPDPDHDLKHGHSGSDVVKENLRQMCIWQQANETYATDYGWRWWNYASLFDTNCVGEAADWNECSREQQLEAGIDPDRTQKCFDDSGTLADGAGDNRMLREELELRSDLSIVVLPTVVVNSIITRGDTSPTAVLKTVCAGFAAGTAPKVCVCDEADPDSLRACLAQSSSSGSKGGSGSGSKAGSGSGSGGGGSKHGQESSSSTDGPGTADEGLPGWAIFLMVLLTLMVMGLAVAGFLFYRRMQAQMKDISGYMALAAGEEDKAAGRRGAGGFRALDEDAPAQDIAAEEGVADAGVGPKAGLELSDVVASTEGATEGEGKDEPHL